MKTNNRLGDAKPWTAVIITVLVLIAVVFTAYGTYTNLKKQVVINNDGQKISLSTLNNTYEEVLKQLSIKLGKYDFLSASLDKELNKDIINELVIKRAKAVSINCDGNVKQLYTCCETVEEFLKEAPVIVYPWDELHGISINDKIYDGIHISVRRVSVKEIRERITIKHETVRYANNNMDAGMEIEKNSGKNGVIENTYMAVYENGMEKNRKLISETVIKQTEDRVLEYGTVPLYMTSRGEKVRYTKVMDMRATSYTASFKDTGKNPDHPEFGITYSGMKARLGVIAVDPKVIPLGTKVYVELLGKTLDYGYAIAADIGSAIKGDLIDLYFADQVSVDNWGCKKVKVYILKDQGIDVFSMR